MVSSYKKVPCRCGGLKGERSKQCRACTMKKNQAPGISDRYWKKKELAEAQANGGI